MAKTSCISRAISSPTGGVIPSSKSSTSMMIDGPLGPQGKQVGQAQAEVGQRSGVEKVAAAQTVAEMNAFNRACQPGLPALPELAAIKSPRLAAQDSPRGSVFCRTISSEKWTEDSGLPWTLIDGLLRVTRTSEPPPDPAAPPSTPARSRRTTHHRGNENAQGHRPNRHHRRQERKDRAHSRGHHPGNETPLAWAIAWASC